MHDWNSMKTSVQNGYQMGIKKARVNVGGNLSKKISEKPKGEDSGRIWIELLWCDRVAAWTNTWLIAAGRM